MRDHSLTASLSQRSGFDVFALAYSPDGKTLAVGDANGDTSLRDVRARSIVATFSDPKGQAAVESVAYSPDGETLAMVDDNGTAYLWNRATRHLRATITFGDAVTGVTAIAFSPDGKTLAVVEGAGVPRSRLAVIAPSALPPGSVTAVRPR